MKLIRIISKYKIYFNKCLNYENLAQFKKYVIVGLLSFTLEYFLFVLFYKVIFCTYYETGFLFAKDMVFKVINSNLKLDTFRYIMANAIVYFVVFWFSFLLNKFWSFDSKGNLGRQLLLYCILFLFNLMLTSGLLYVLSGVLGITPLISKVLIMGVIVSWNFIIYKKIIYR